jgi:hypothetical protein
MTKKKYNQPRRTRVAKPNNNEIAVPSRTFNSERPGPDPCDLALVDVEDATLTEPDDLLFRPRLRLIPVPPPASSSERAAPEQSDPAIIDAEGPCLDELERREMTTVRPCSSRSVGSGWRSARSRSG